MNRGALFAALARRMACFSTALLLLLGASPAYSVTTAVWKSGLTGNWTDVSGAGWTGAAYPSLSGDIGQYASNANAVTTLNLSGIKVGSLQKTFSFSWTIAADGSNDALTMDNGASSATITCANNASFNINVPLVLASDLAVSTAATAQATTITLNGTITGPKAVTLSANNTGTTGTFASTITVADLNNGGAVTVNGNIGANGTSTSSKTAITSIGSNVTNLTKTGTGELQINGGTLAATVTAASIQTIKKAATSAMLTVSGNNSATFDGLWFATSPVATTDAGSLKFSSSDAIGSSNAKIVTSLGGVVVAGYAIDQAFVDRFTTAAVNGQAASANGIIALGADSSNNIDMRGTSGLLSSTMSLGAVGTATYSGVLTPNGTTYFLGGSGGRLILNTANAFTGARAMTIGNTNTSNSQQASSVIQMAADQNYTGVTTINSGTLSVSHLADGGIASGIGNSTSVATNLMLATVTNAPTAYLEYTGSGDTTNRLFSLQNSRVGGGILNNGTGGALTFSNNGTIVINTGISTFNKTVTLGGSNTADNTFAPKLADVPTATANGTVSFVKADAGKWILTNANTYTGTTTVSGGTLLINGNGTAATGAMSVGSGATLGGTGILGGNATVTGTLLGGNGTTGTTLTSGKDVTFADGSTISLALNSSHTHSTLARTGGTWTFDNVGNNQAFTFLNLGGATTGVYSGIITGLASDPGTGSWTITNSLWNGSFIYNSGSVDLNLTAVPEPATWALLAFSLTTVVVLRRRRS